MPSRRALLSIGASALCAVPGCLSLRGRGTAGADDGTTTVSTSTATDAVTTASDTTGTGRPGLEQVDVEDLSVECPSEGIDHLPGTTPLPKPQAPDSITADSATAYAESYERYYLRYRALFELGGQTPDGRAGVSPHDFPDVRMDDPSVEALATGTNRATVRLAYERVFEAESRGEYTVTYLVTSGETIRAEVEGRVSPGPDPTEEGLRQRC